MKLPAATRLLATSLLSGQDPAARPASLLGALDTLRESAAAELGETAQVLYRAGEELAREAWADGEPLGRGRDRDTEPRPPRLSRGLREAMRLLGRDASSERARLEARARFDVYWQVRRARTAHGSPRDGRPFDLEPALRRALAHGSFWALEGLAHDYAMGTFESGRWPRHLLAHPALESLDEGALAAMHAGLGLAAADFIAGGLRARDGAARFEAAVDRFARCCRENARHEVQVEVALEALGLVVSVFHPPLRGGFEAALRLHPRLRRLYWHGAGRGAYFGGAQLLPGYGSLTRALSTTRAAADRPTDLESALAGLGYAFTMVNIARPSVVGGLLAELEPAGVEAADVEAADIEAAQDPAAESVMRGLGLGLAGALAMQRLLGQGERAARFLEVAAETMPAARYRLLVAEPDRELRSLGSRHPLYGALPWGQA